MITIQGVGKFPPQGEPTVLWAGVEGSPSLIALHHSIAAALTEAFGFQPEVRQYSPHVTLALLKIPAPPGAVERFLDDNKGFVVSPVLLDRFALYSSVLVDDVPQYRLEAEFRFPNLTV
jgi:2'-5' RNA ligase